MFWRMIAGMTPAMSGQSPTKGDDVEDVPRDGKDNRGDDVGGRFEDVSRNVRIF